MTKYDKSRKGLGVIEILLLYILDEVVLYQFWAYANNLRMYFESLEHPVKIQPNKKNKNKVKKNTAK